MTEVHERRERRSAIWTFVAMLAGVVAVPLLGGRLVHVAIAAAVAAVFSVVWWWATTVGVVAEPADWRTDAKVSLRGRGSDARASRLQRQVRDVLEGNRSMGSDVVLAKTLAALIDDRMLTRHGLDLAVDPERYEAVAGPDLARLVRDVAAGDASIRSRDLPVLIDRIERL